MADDEPPPPSLRLLPFQCYLSRGTYIGEAVSNTEGYKREEQSIVGSVRSMDGITVVH